MKTFERLNKNEMKMILGGVDEEISEEIGGGAGYKCCYTNPTGCSKCDPKATSSSTCTNNGHSNGTLTAC